MRPRVRFSPSCKHFSSKGRFPWTGHLSGVNSVGLTGIIPLPWNPNRHSVLSMYPKFSDHSSSLNHFLPWSTFHFGGKSIIYKKRHIYIPLNIKLIFIFKSVLWASGHSSCLLTMMFRVLLSPSCEGFSLEGRFPLPDHLSDVNSVGLTLSWKPNRYSLLSMYSRSSDHNSWHKHYLLWSACHFVGKSIP